MIKCKLIIESWEIILEIFVWKLVFYRGMVVCVLGKYFKNDCVIVLVDKGLMRGF